MPGGTVALFTLPLVGRVAAQQRGGGGGGGAGGGGGGGCGTDPHPDLRSDLPTRGR
ncbi:hypothetical protein X730_07375 [Mesorhizobium sp. L103C565B0]|nr:hypothetical protein X730_07375 [Mesorhizobium sp. L103C565B0]